MGNDQTRALAQELVDFISGEPKRFEEEQAAKLKGHGLDRNTRRERLADEVAMKIDAVMTAEGSQVTGNDDRTKPAKPAKPDENAHSRK